MEIFAQEGTTHDYPERYNFNNNLIELRNHGEIAMGAPLAGGLFINGTEASLLNGKEYCHYTFGGPIILTEKYIYIPLFDSRKESKRIFHFWNYTYTSMGYYISRVSYNGDIEILSEKFPLVHLIKKEDNTLFFRARYKGEIKSIVIPPE